MYYMEDQIANAGQNFIGEHGWLLIAGAVGLIFKETITSFAAAISMSLFGGIKTDDVYSMGGRACRVVRVGFLKTIFYMTDRGTKMIVPNDRLKLLVIEKKLPLNGGFHYLHKGGEEGYEKQRAIREKMKELPKLPEDK